MATYRVTMTSGYSWLLNANLVQSAAPLSANFHDADSEHDWQGTPYQTADAGHEVTRAAKLVAEYFRDGPDDDDEVESVKRLSAEDDN